jgi:hypothetical protein
MPGKSGELRSLDSRRRLFPHGSSDGAVLDKLPTYSGPI